MYIFGSPGQSLKIRRYSRPSCSVHGRWLARAEAVPEKAARQTIATDTVVAIRLNRRRNIDLAKVVVPPTGFKQVWFFWAGSPDPRTWCLYGDARVGGEYFEFQHPGVDAV